MDCRFSYGYSWCTIDAKGLVSLVSMKLALYFLLFHFELEHLIISFIPHVNRFLSFIVHVMHGVCSVVYCEFLIPCNYII